MISELQEAGLSLVPTGCAFEAALVEDHSAELSPKARRLIESWAPQRQDEFATGRLCARRALLTLGFEACDLLPDREGIPVWPKGAIGSISHSRGVAVAVAARCETSTLLGLDLEKTNRLSDAAIRRVVHPLEEAFAAGKQRNASILFSLKEAFYKAQYPQWRTSGNFHDLALSVDMEAGTAAIQRVDPRFAPDLQQLRFAFRLVDEYVVSLSIL